MKSSADVRKKILIADDVPASRELIGTILDEAGYNVIEASNGTEALNKARELTPDLILLDLSMPVMDGWATLRKLKSDERTQSITVLALSAHAIIGDAERAVNAGFDGYMTKPISVPTLLQDLRSALKHRNISNDLDPQPSVTKDESVS